MYNKELEILNKELTNAALIAKKIWEELGKELSELSKKEKRSNKDEERLDNLEYAYTYLKDTLEWASRVKVALKHADIFINELK